MPSNLIVENDVEMVTSDGVILRADVYRPDRGGPFPVLLSRTCYGKGGIPGLMMTINPLRFAREGFAVVVQDVRGRYASEGTHKPFFEAQDGYEAVQWCAQQPWSNGDVGMFGSSYQAAAQVQPVALAPEVTEQLGPRRPIRGIERLQLGGGGDGSDILTVSAHRQGVVEGGTGIVRRLARQRIEHEERARLFEECQGRVATAGGIRAERHQGRVGGADEAFDATASEEDG